MWRSNRSSFARESRRNFDLRYAISLRLQIFPNARSCSRTLSLENHKSSPRVLYRIGRGRVSVGDNVNTSTPSTIESFESARGVGVGRRVPIEREARASRRWRRFEFRVVEGNVSRNRNNVLVDQRNLDRFSKLSIHFETLDNETSPRTFQERDERSNLDQVSNRIKSYPTAHSTRDIYLSTRRVLVQRRGFTVLECIFRLEAQREFRETRGSA